MKINNRVVSNQNYPYIIAELSANHNGSLERAFMTIKAAKESGADAVKIQSYTADSLTIKSNREEFQINSGLWKGYDLYSLYQKAETPFEWHKPLFDYGKEIGITIFSTPFDYASVDLLEDLNTPAYKIASFEITDLPLLKYIAKTKKPIIISTGMANFEEISEAVDTVKENGCNDLALLHCISSYPAPPEQSNLRTIPDLIENFKVPVGLSDHTMGTTVALSSIALGATIIEKHFTLNRHEEGPDSKFSIEPHQLSHLCKESKIAYSSLGIASYELKDVEKQVFNLRRSLYAVKNIKKGEKFTTENVRSIRPGLGIKPKYLDKILGTYASKNIEFGSPLSFEDINLKLQ